jgi:type III pantothenate kinase
MTHETWLGLVIGNSRLHWGLFRDRHLHGSWHTPHVRVAQAEMLMHQQFTYSAFSQISTNIPPFPEACRSSSHLLPLWVATVVPQQLTLWQAYPDLHVVTLAHIPLSGTYPTLGVDRALAVWGAGQEWGFPVLVIDAGTALTLTGADATGHLIGGAIAPGLQMQFQALSQHAAQLPQLELSELPTLPDRWARNTPAAIASGIIYTLLSGIREFVQDWLGRYPQSAIVLTGGDGALLLRLVSLWLPELGALMNLAPDLVLQGLGCSHGDRDGERT